MGKMFQSMETYPWHFGRAEKGRERMTWMKRDWGAVQTQRQTRSSALHPCLRHERLDDTLLGHLVNAVGRDDAHELDLVGHGLREEGVESESAPCSTSGDRERRLTHLEHGKSDLVAPGEARDKQSRKVSMEGERAQGVKRRRGCRTHSTKPYASNW